MSSPSPIYSKMLHFPWVNHYQVPEMLQRLLLLSHFDASPMTQPHRYDFITGGSIHCVEQTDPCQLLGWMAGDCVRHLMQYLIL